MHELVRRFDTLVGDVRPDLVITHSAHDLHWDHGLVNRATVSALRRTPCDLLAYLSSPEMNAQSRVDRPVLRRHHRTRSTRRSRRSRRTSRSCRKLDLESIARSRARDGPDQRLRVRGGLRSAARAGVAGKRHRALFMRPACDSAAPAVRPNLAKPTKDEVPMVRMAAFALVISATACVLPSSSAPKSGRGRDRRAAQRRRRRQGVDHDVEGEGRRRPSTRTPTATRSAPARSTQTRPRSTR